MELASFQNRLFQCRPECVRIILQAVRSASLRCLLAIPFFAHFSILFYVGFLFCLLEFFDYAISILFFFIDLLTKSSANVFSQLSLLSSFEMRDQFLVVERQLGRDYSMQNVALERKNGPKKSIRRLSSICH